MNWALLLFREILLFPATIFGNRACRSRRSGCPEKRVELLLITPQAGKDGVVGTSGIMKMK